MNKRIACSVAILTRNSAATLARALESVKAFDDLIVCDGGSTDETVAIATRYGARVIQQEAQYKNGDGSIADFAGMRNTTLKEARHEWFLYIDSDEYLSEEAVHEIGALIASYVPGLPSAYRLPRKTVIAGTVIECATSYPNYQLRLFRTDATSGFIKRVHERPKLHDGVTVGTLSHPEFVPLDCTPSEYRRKQLYYLTLEAARHEGMGVMAWLTGPVFHAVKSSLSYLLRHVRLLGCHGKKMPLWVELTHYWYNWKLVVMTGATLYPLRKRKKR